MSPLPPDPYKALGVSKDAQLSEIRSAHRKLVLKCHPDKIQDAQLKEEKQKEFQQVQQAYELLSNETERNKYDDQVKLEELKRESRMASASTSSPRPTRHEKKYYSNVDIRDAEPRPSTFATSPGSHNVYSHTPPSRSWDEDIYAKRFDEKPRYARKTQSYEYEREKPSRKEEERRRRKEDEEWNREREKARNKEEKIREAVKDREREREKEAMREKERESAKKEKDRRKDDRKDEKKRSDKERRKDTDDKHRRHNKTPYVEGYPEEEAIYTSSSSKTEKKSSSSRKFEDAPPVAAAAPPPPRETSRPPATDRERKNSETLESAIRYLSRSGGNPPALGRAQTYHAEFNVRHITPIAVPTPPPAANAVFTPPPVAEEREHAMDDDAGKRSSGRPRRPSHDTPRSSKEKTAHKKTSASREPLIVEATSPTPSRVIPTFHKSHSIPIPIQSDHHRVPPLSRANTDGFSRPISGLARSSTWMPETEHVRERSRSRHARVYSDESSEDERRHRRGHRTQSPEPTIQAKRYTVDSNRRTVPIQESYFPEDMPRSSKKSYPAPNSSVRRSEPRAAYYDDYEEAPRAFFPDVKYSQQFDVSEVKYADVLHSSLREEVF
ncbi:DnaJ-domain-containing protein [Hypoxylon fragiforme]|uniref:DnaJ-domain-containing protein n=1 Tax=Hypoxylon fragiforme TaxID=63214 RepID=UPI0020C7237B|nr:DnaJ-domain-containing protein [Hypoxylon fragiforme]KAI2608930.1 DnaJ-domain-containing protein [Hypoxylon fragiforme]